MIYTDHADLDGNIRVEIYDKDPLYEEPLNTKICKIKGYFTKCDSVNQNARIYPKTVWERIIAEFNNYKQINKNIKGYLGIFRENSGIFDGRTDLASVSHMVERLELHGDKIYGELKVLDSEQGKKLIFYLENKIDISLVTRGYGSILAKEQGVEIIQDDFKLVTFDFITFDKNVKPCVAKEVIYG